MWTFVMFVCLLDQDQAAPLPWEPSSLPLLLQQQVTQTTPSLTPDAGQQKTLSSSSSSSSSSSASSESSQSSEEPQLLQERQNLENTAVEQLDWSEESWERSSNSSNSSVWLSELVLLGDRAGRRDGGEDTGDDSEESREGRQRALMLTFQQLLSRLQGPDVTAAGPGGATTEGGGITTASVGGARGEEGVVIGDGGGVRGAEPDVQFPQLLDDSSERDDGLTLDSPDHAHHHDYHGNEEGLELGL